jgi:hypothetical protein
MISDTYNHYKSFYERYKHLSQNELAVAEIFGACRANNWSKEEALRRIVTFSEAYKRLPDHKADEIKKPKDKE